MQTINDDENNGETMSERGERERAVGLRGGCGVC